MQDLLEELPVFRSVWLVACRALHRRRVDLDVRPLEKGVRRVVTLPAEILQWLILARCPWNKEHCGKIARENGHTNLAAWIRRHPLG